MPSSFPNENNQEENDKISLKKQLRSQKFREELTEKIHTYYQETPTAKICLNYLKEKYPFVMPQIDHLAFRSLSVKSALDFDEILDSNYLMIGSLEFPLKPTDKFYKKAFYYKHPVYSRLFSSYIKINDQDQFKIKNIIEDQSLSDLEKYQKLIKIDQYLAWTVIWDKSINHIAFDLSQYPDSFEKIISEMVQDLGLEMNPYPEPNPLVVTSRDGLLQQASTRADYVNGIPKAYIEFVNRKIDPRTNERREGFDTFNANQLFESTFLEKK